jgi:HPt (histidine-containing phosphotransfer) domain-containing protein
MSDPLESAFKTLQVEYLASMPAVLEGLRSDIAGFKAGHQDATDSLKVRLHRLAGSAGSYRLLELSTLAREAERWLASSPAPGEADQLESIVDRMAKVVEEVGKRGGGAAGQRGSEAG